MSTAAAVAADAAFFADLRAREFARLDGAGVAYLDYTGSGVHAASQLAAHHWVLAGGVFGNPHAEHEASRASTAAMDEARAATLRFFGVDASTHVVCFTANASAAIKLVGESYPFSPARGLVLSADNHNSVNGVAEYARRAGAPVTRLPLDRDLRLDRPIERLRAAAVEGGLLAFPAQSNFSGVRHPLDLVAEARANGMTVLLDAAAYVPTSPLDLSRCLADFLSISFYKMFGYPTGIGALIARRDALERLSRPWFAGGTVDYVSLQHGRHQLRAGHEAFEDGTPNFLGALAVPDGLRVLREVGQPRLSNRIRALTAQVIEGLTDLSHEADEARVVIYGPAGLDDRGGTVAFNVTDRDGVVVPYWEVEARARDAGVSVRGGCFCNPGAAEAAFGFDPEGTARCLDTLGADFSIPRFAACLGPTAVVGAVRLSVGLATTEDDIARALAVVRACTPVARPA